MARLPWVGPILPSLIHLPTALAWAVATSHETPCAVLAWQAAAWPLLAFVSLATMSPLLWLVKRMRVELPGSNRVVLAGGSCFGVAASLAFLFGARGVSAFVAVWCLAFLAALAFEQWFAMPRR